MKARCCERILKLRSVFAFSVTNSPNPQPSRFRIACIQRFEVLSPAPAGKDALQNPSGPEVHSRRAQPSLRGIRGRALPSCSRCSGSHGRIPAGTTPPSIRGSLPQASLACRCGPLPLFYPADTIGAFQGCLKRPTGITLWGNSNHGMGNAIYRAVATRRDGAVPSAR